MFNDQSYTVVYVNSYNVQWHTHSSHTKKFNQNFNQKVTRYFQHFQAGPLCNVLKKCNYFWVDATRELYYFLCISCFMYI